MGCVANQVVQEKNVKYQRTYIFRLKRPIERGRNTTNQITLKSQNLIRE